jgi:hypothetical protein
MSRQITLDDLRAAYKRTTSRIYRILEDGYDFGVDQLIVEALDRDALIIDAAFLVLVFGQIETRVNRLATARSDTARRRQALRDQSFERRLDLALRGDDMAEIRHRIAIWYSWRNDAAHGERITSGYDVADMFETAYELEAILSEQLARLQAPGEGPQ